MNNHCSGDDAIIQEAQYLLLQRRCAWRCAEKMHRELLSCEHVIAAVHKRSKGTDSQYHSIQGCTCSAAVLSRLGRVSPEYLEHLQRPLYILPFFSSLPQNRNIFYTGSKLRKPPSLPWSLDAALFIKMGISLTIAGCVKTKMHILRFTWPFPQVEGRATRD